MPINHSKFRAIRVTKSGQRGFTLIETMVAFLILAVGLLGLAGLQNTGFQVNQNAYYRTQAAFLAQDMAERMRSNRIEAVADNYINESGLSDGTVEANCLTTTGCSSSAMAANDIYEWQTAVADLLPGGEAVICVDKVPNDGDNASSPNCDGLETSVDEPVYAIKIWWADPFSDTVGDKQLYVSSVTP